MSLDPEIITSLPTLPARPAEAHKGTFGTVVMVGGCGTMPGAPALTARAALRSGAGLVKLAADAATLSTALSVTPSATGVRLTGDPEADAASLQRADPEGRAVLAIGPGWGVTPGVPDRRSELLGRLWRGPRPIVIDADGLNVLAEMSRRGELDHEDEASPESPHAPRVLTPHPGEFRRLAAHPMAGEPIDADPTSSTQRPLAAAALARAFQATVVLKGQHTVVGDRDTTRVFRNATGNPALATAGTGDVLTGLIAGLIAQGAAPFEAARLGVFIHGSAADRWASRHGHAGLLAHELCDGVPDVLNEMRR
ncbi:MAG: NAD(P)H-hydrate dehydratase [Planctomycetota bacterium]